MIVLIISNIIVNKILWHSPIHSETSVVAVSKKVFCKSEPWHCEMKCASNVTLAHWNYATECTSSDTLGHWNCEIECASNVTPGHWNCAMECASSAYPWQSLNGRKSTASVVAVLQPRISAASSSRRIWMISFALKRLHIWILISTHTWIQILQDLTCHQNQKHHHPKCVFIVKFFKPNKMFVVSVWWRLSPINNSFVILKKSIVYQNSHLQNLEKHLIHAQQQNLNNWVSAIIKCFLFYIK